MLELHGWLGLQKKKLTIFRSAICTGLGYTGLGLTSFVAFTLPISAQTNRANSLTPQIITPNLRSPSPQLPDQTPAPLPSPDELLNPSREPVAPQKEVPVTGTITVNRFEVLGSTVFTKTELDQILNPFTKRPITFSELLQARSQITDLYTSRGYITSGAFIPTQNLQNGVVQIQVIEGGLEDIKVTGVERFAHVGK
jgi:hemolysin activation/secretion protein